jgi:hypothetical protein
MAGFFFPGADKIIQGVLGGSPLRIRKYSALSTSNIIEK